MVTFVEVAKKKKKKKNSPYEHSSFYKIMSFFIESNKLNDSIT